MTVTVLDQWLIHRMGWVDPKTPPTPEQLRRWQLEQLQEIIGHARSHSPFYASHLGDETFASIASFEDYARLPMISPELLRKYPKQLLCVSQDDIERIVTVETSGTTGKPKRIFYTREDIEATREYFAWGMANLVGPGGNVFVLLPGDRPEGVGLMLMDAVESLGAGCIVHGTLQDSGAAVDHLLAEEADCVVGPPAHVNMLAREWMRRGLPTDRVRSVLLCWDATPQAVVKNVREAFGCRVFRHWGMIETGQGGAVECSPGSGLHLRETDVLVEIVDPDTGRLVPDGEFGEMVVTTLLRKGMPLIRYRTGDRGRILAGQCRCGSPMRRLDADICRIGTGLDIGTGFLRFEDLSEALYEVQQLDDFAAWLEGGVLNILACIDGAGAKSDIMAALETIPVLKSALDVGLLGLGIQLKMDKAPAVGGLGKRCFQNPRSS